MKREVLEYAALPDAPLSQLSKVDQIVAGIAWLADNEGYGIKEAAKSVIDNLRRLVAELSKGEPVARVGQAAKDGKVTEWKQFRPLSIGDNLYIATPLPADHVADAKDAQRYRWLRMGNQSHLIAGIWIKGESDFSDDDWPNAEAADSAIDAAMLAAAGEGRG